MKANDLRKGIGSSKKTFLLYDKNIGESEVRELALILKDTPTITYLYLGHNKIGDSGAKELVEMLKTNFTLIDLTLEINHIDPTILKTIKECLQKNSNLAEKKAETLNIKGNNLCVQEKYKAAIIIKKRLDGNINLYEENKVKAEKQYEEQKQTLELNNLIAAIKENKLEDAENLAKNINEHIFNKVDNNCNTVLHLAIEHGLNQVAEILINKMSLEAINLINNNGYTALTQAASKGLEQISELLITKASEQDASKARILLKEYAEQKAMPKDKLALFEKIVLEVLSKLENMTINERDKAILQGRINEIAKSVKNFTNKDEINTMINSIEDFITKGKFTKARIAVVEEELNEIIEQRIKLEEQIRIEKLNIFEETIAKIMTKIESIDVKDKDIMQESIKEIVSKVKRLDNKNDIEVITESVKELINSRITKTRIAVIEEDLDQFLINPELSQIVINKEQTFNFIQQAMNNKDPDLVLAGLIGLENDQASPAG